MNPTTTFTAFAICDAAKRRLVSLKGDPFLFADWERVVFLHFVIAPELLGPHVPKGFDLELHDGRAVVSLVALTMRRFRPCRRGSLAWLFRPIAQQRFINLRTYVSASGEPGALFLWGWLSRPFFGVHASTGHPFSIPLPSGVFGLPYAFASLDYRHDFETGQVRGSVMAGPQAHGFVYRTTGAPPSFGEPVCVNQGTGGTRCPALCAPGSLAEFAMERYTGFFCRRASAYVFRVWHPSWLQTALDVTIEENSLLTEKFPWFKEATLAAANFAPGFERVWLGRAHRLETAAAAPKAKRSTLSAFYEMP